MKTITTLILLFASSLAFSQIVNIPDANFKAKLLEADVNNSIATDSSNNSIKVDLNNDGEIQESEALNIRNLNIQYSNISNLEGIQSFINLEALYCNNNMLTSLSLVDNPNLGLLYCNNNMLTSLSFVNNPNLDVLECNDNLLTSLDISNNHLSYLYCQNNQLSFLDISHFYVFLEVFCWNNPPLTYINVKNGNINGIGTIVAFNNPNLTYVCTNEADIQSLNNYFNNQGMTVNVNSYCSFTPGGDYNTITGNSSFDLTNNGCDASDIPFPFLKLNINDGTDTGSAFTTNSGEYNFFTQDGNFTITPELENPTFFNATPIDATVNFTDVNNNIEIQDFCLTANGVHNDLEILVASTIPARPGFDAEYIITYKNKGNQTVSGEFIFNYDDTVLDFLNATETPTTQTVGLLTWNYVDLLPFESSSVYVTLNVNSPMETPAINIDDELLFSVSINPVTADESPYDNTFDYNQVVVGSFDPNDIICLEGTVLEPSAIGEYLHYIINFENTGNAPAQNIVVKTIIDQSLYNINSLQFLSSSHNPVIKIEGNTLEFIFESIFLAASEQGNIVLKIKSQDNLQTGDTVTKNAEIFFDYNFPIDTNDANTTYTILSNPEFETDSSLVIYPNPVKNTVIIKVDNTIKNVSIYDVQGRLILTKITSQKEVKIYLSTQAKGVYFAKITTEKGTNMEQIIKQ